MLLIAIEYHSEALNCFCEKYNLKKVLEVGFESDNVISQSSSLKVINYAIEKLMEKKIEYQQQEEMKEAKEEESAE